LTLILNLETRVEAVWNTSTVTLRVVGGDEKRSLKSEAVKWTGLGTEKGYVGDGEQHI
jgi:hypothetical protein